MRKTFAGAAAGLGAAVLTAAMAVSVFAAQTNEAGAKDIALKHAGVSSDEVVYAHTKLDYEKGEQVYDVEFVTKDYREYDYEIRVSDGAILGFDYDAEGAYLSKNGRPQGEIKVTLEQAKEAALKHAGKKTEDVTFSKTGLDYDDGIASYEVEFYTADFAEYDYEIDAYTGAVLSYDYDAESRQGAGKAASAQGAVGLEQAKEIALNQAGLKSSQISRFNARQDYDDGRLVYEGKFFSGDMEYEFEIDANTGRILDWDVESIYD